MQCLQRRLLGQPSRLFRSPFLPSLTTPSTFVQPRRNYCDAGDEDDELPQGEEFVMLRQAKKTSKKRLEAKKKQANAWKNIVWQSWTHMYRPEHAKEALKAIKKQSRYDDVVLTPKDGERYIRVYRARQIQEQNQAREFKCFPKSRS